MKLKPWIWCLVCLFVFVAAFGYMRQAKADSIIVLGLSKHFGTDKAHQERNWGAGYERNGWAFGAYRNSNNRRTAFALRQIWRYEITESIAFSLPVGLATGYNGFVIPAAVPTFSYRLAPHYTVDMGVMPALAGKQSIIGLQLRVDLGAFR